MTASPLERLRQVARDPREYVGVWRSAHPGARVAGVLPMNFPRELVFAAGMLPVVVPDDQVPISEGRAFLPEFYCGYTRNLADQVATGRFDLYDVVLLADHCISLVGAADVIRMTQPETPVIFDMLAPSLNDPWMPKKVTETLTGFRERLEAVADAPITDESLRASIATGNASRRALRELLDERSSGSSTWSAVELLDVVASSMVMDPVDHLALLEQARAEKAEQGRDERVRVHLSGHLCHAPRRDLLEVIEASGAQVVDDDLWTGRRYPSTDVDETGDPMAALSTWYAARNVSLPCPTRAQQDVDWDSYLVEAVGRSGAEAVIHLMPKFCEPHMLYYPELRKALEAAGIPQLLIETEHGGIPPEALRTRVEALVERTLRKRPAFA